MRYLAVQGILPGGDNCSKETLKIRPELLALLIPMFDVPGHFPCKFFRQQDMPFQPPAFLFCPAASSTHVPQQAAVFSCCLLPLMM